ncbi:hypothetical protein PG989_001251 [Apiospora arundinis]
MSNANTNPVPVMKNYEDTVNKVTEMLNTNENQQANTMENSNKSPEPTPTKPARKNPLVAAKMRNNQGQGHVQQQPPAPVHQLPPQQVHPQQQVPGPQQAPEPGLEGDHVRRHKHRLERERARVNAREVIGDREHLLGQARQHVPQRDQEGHPGPGPQVCPVRGQRLDRRQGRGLPLKHHPGQLQGRHGEAKSGTKTGKPRIYSDAVMAGKDPFFILEGVSPKQTHEAR